MTFCPLSTVWGAVSENKPVLAAVNRCATQNREQQRLSSPLIPHNSPRKTA
jgi:hypothetical protein